MAETKEKITMCGKIRHLTMTLNYGAWEFREDILVPNDYKIDKDSEPYKTCKERLINNIKSKFPNYVN